MTTASHELVLTEINNGKRYDERCKIARREEEELQEAA